MNGVPEEKEENVIDVVKKIRNSAGVQIEENTIDACHGLGPKLDVSV